MASVERSTSVGPLYVTTRALAPDGSIIEVPLTRPLTPDEAARLAPALRARGVELRTAPVAIGPGRRASPAPDAPAPMTPWQRQMASLYAPEPTRRATRTPRVRVDTLTSEEASALAALVRAELRARERSRTR